MKLIMQTYIKDTVDRKTQSTYKPFPKLERLSRECFKKYAKIHNCDYEYFTPPTGEAHWIRMEMFKRPQYDEVLYVDCDILIHPDRYTDNIFDYKGVGVQKVHFYNHSFYNMINAGVTKWTAEECKTMGKYINKYYHPTHNQDMINICYKTHVGKMTYLPYKFNVTHKPSDETVFRHYAGSWKLAAQLKKDPIWRHYK